MKWSGKPESTVYMLGTEDPYKKGKINQIIIFHFLQSFITKRLWGKSPPVPDNIMPSSVHNHKGNGHE